MAKELSPDDDNIYFKHHLQSFCRFFSSFRLLPAYLPEVVTSWRKHFIASYCRHCGNTADYYYLHISSHAKKLLTFLKMVTSPLRNFRKLYLGLLHHRCELQCTQSWIVLMGVSEHLFIAVKWLLPHTSALLVLRSVCPKVEHHYCRYSHT